MAGEDKSINPAGPTSLADDSQQESTEQLAKAPEAQSNALGTPIDEQLDLETLRSETAASRRKRIITIVIALIIFAGGVTAYLVLTGNANQTVELDPFEMPLPVRKGTFVDDVSGSGKASPNDSGVVTPEVSGIIENLNLTVGQEVKEGDVLFTLKNSSLDDDVRKAQEAVDTAQRELDAAWNKVGACERARDAAYRSRDVTIRARDNAWNKANESGDWSEYDDNHLTNDIDSATESIDKATDDVNDAYLTKDGAEANLASKQADLEITQQKADKRTVKAPMSGSIIAVNAENGQSVGGAEGGTSDSSSSNSKPLVQIANSTQMKITVQINEVDIEAIEIGQPCTVTFQAISGLSLDSTVKNIADVASSGSGESDSGSGIVTYAVELLVDNKDGKIKPGMTANVDIITQQIDDVLIAPLNCVFGIEEGNPHVLRITDAEEKQYESVPVQVTAQSAAEAVIEGDVSDGDQLLGSDLEAAAAAADAALAQ